MQSCGVRVIVKVLKKAVQTIRNDENAVRHSSMICKNVGKQNNTTQN